MKKLTRNRKDKVLFGVCGGIGKYFDIDPVIIRIIFIVLLFTAGTGLIAYIIAIFLIPEEDKSFFNKRYSNKDESNGNTPPVNENMGKKEMINIDPADQSENKSKSSGNSSEITGTIIGIVLIVFGTLFLMRNFSFLDNIYYSIMPVVRRFFWPGILIGLGALVIYKNKNN